MAEDRVMEALLRTRESLERAQTDGESVEYPYRFGSWSLCTCGHVYIGATGEKGTNDDVFLVARTDGLYEETMKAIVASLPPERSYQPESTPEYLSTVVSNATYDGSGLNALSDAELTEADEDETLRVEAFAIVNRAIDFREGEQRAAMDKVAGR